MTISNQFLAIPPDHPLAKEFYNLECIQSTFIAHLSPVHPHYDAAKNDEHEKNLALVDDAIRFLQGQYRHERGGDESCTVGLTRGPNGYPVVDGRPSNGDPFIQPGKPQSPVRN